MFIRKVPFLLVQLYRVVKLLHVYLFLAFSRVENTIVPTSFKCHTSCCAAHLTSAFISDHNSSNEMKTEPSKISYATKLHLRLHKNRPYSLILMFCSLV